ncbi:hypothetical protein VTO73DRAFT_4242 [Trametes versicolor]
MDLPKPCLKPDILLKIMRLADAKTICAFMQTRKEFYKMGAEYLLQDGVSLTTDAHIESFDAFILTDPSSRLPLLRHLTLARSPENSTNPIWTGLLINKLFSNLAAHGRLLTLTVRYSEDLLCSWEELPHTVARLSTLEHLKITSVGPQGFLMLENLSSCLLSAHISLNEELWDEEESFPALALSSSSRNFMQRMSLSGFSGCWPPKVPFPNVTSLALRHGRIPRTLELVRCFPSLRELRMLFVDILPGESLAEERVINQEQQRRFGTWTSLRRFSGSSRALFVLAIQSHIPSLMLHDEHPIFQLPKLNVAIQHARPLHLELSMSTGASLINLHYLSLFVAPGMGDHLLSLCLTLYIRPFEKNLDTKKAWDFIDRIAASLTQLESLDITFTLCFSVATIRPNLRFVEKLTEGWNLDSMAQHLCYNRYPRPLKSVTLSLLNHRTRGDQKAQFGPVHTPEIPYGRDVRDLLFHEDDEPCTPKVPPCVAEAMSSVFAGGGSFDGQLTLR